MDARQELDWLVRACERGRFSTFEFENKLLTHLHQFPDLTDHALDLISRHANKDLQAIARRVRAMRRHRELSQDFDYVRRTSPLQPGTRMILSGGYDYHSSRGQPAWLAGRDGYKATFLSFAARGVGRVPAAFVELDEEIDLPGHRGRFAVLTDSYPTASVAWAAEGTARVYIVPALPDDLAGFTYPEAVETHAQYEVVPALAEIARQIGQTLDELADGADPSLVRRLHRLLARAPALRSTVIPALIPLLRHAATEAAVQGLLRDLGPPALRALFDGLSSDDPWLRERIVAALGSFGPAAREVLPALEKLLYDELHVRVQAARAIWRIDGRTPEMARVVLEGVPSYAIAADAAACLREMGCDAADVVPALVEILTGSQVASWRAQAALALGGMGHEAAPAVAALIAAAEDGNTDVSDSALDALRELRALTRTAELILQAFA